MLKGSLGKIDDLVFGFEGIIPILLSFLGSRFYLLLFLICLQNIFYCVMMDVGENKY